MFGIPMNWLGAGAVLAFGAAYVTQPTWWPALKQAVGLGPKKTDRMAALAALDSAFDYFEAEGCEEGMSGVRALIPHVYHHHDEAQT